MYTMQTKFMCLRNVSDRPSSIKTHFMLHFTKKKLKIEEKIQV